jgi:TonB family protein
MTLRHAIWWVLGILLSAASVASANPSEIVYAAPGAWVLPPPSVRPEPAPEGALLKSVYADAQVRVTAAGVESFSGYRLTILRPEGLAVGNITLSWNPAAGEIRVHQLRIIRDGKPIDVLAETRFRVIQREENLEQASLSGELTATLQVPGLTVGDDLEFGATVHTRDPTIGDRAFDALQLPIEATPGAFRLKLNWPADSALRWRASTGLPPVTVRRVAGENQLLYQLDNPGTAVPVEGAPLRYNVRRLVEYSEFASWNEVSRRFSNLFSKAATLAPDSALRAEVARIAAASSDPRDRTVAALRLVQDQIRYVYIGFGGGNFRPVTADETWQRRYGDCKAKTALLLALLHELGIPAEAVLVNLDGGDGSDVRLPSPAAFNHILVRATFKSAAYWLDGTRNGDIVLANIPPPVFRWALPVRDAGATLEAVAPLPRLSPDIVEVTDIDASAGFDKPAKLRLGHIYRGDAAVALGLRLAALSKADADRQLSAYFRGRTNGLSVTSTTWSRDPTKAVLTLSVEGSQMQDWDGDTGHVLNIPGAGFSPPAELRRPADQDQTAPWLVEFPLFRCWATTVRLPQASPEKYWAYTSSPVDRTLGGIVWWRRAGLKAGIIRTVMSKRSVVAEISAADAITMNAKLSKFDKAVSRVYEMDDFGIRQPGQSKSTPFDDDTNWSGENTPCAAPISLAGPPVGMQEKGIYNSDYPVASVINGEEGVVKMNLQVSEEGHVVDCKIASSSGFPTLDDATCSLIRSRFLYKPARNDQGVAIIAFTRQPVRWRIAEGVPRPLMFGVRFLGERLLADGRRLCQFTDYAFTLAPPAACMRQLPKAGPADDGKTIVDVLQTAVAKGERRAAFELGTIMQNLLYDEAKPLLRTSAAQGFTPAAWQLCRTLDFMAPTPAVIDEALSVCEQAADQGVPAAIEVAARLVFAARQRLGTETAATRLEARAAMAPIAQGLLAQLWQDAGAPEKALPYAYLAARTGQQDAWEILGEIFAASGSSVYNPSAAYVWGRVAGVPVDAIAAKLSQAEREDAEENAKTCIEAVTKCTAGETQAMRDALMKDRLRPQLRKPERLDVAATDSLAIPDSAGIALTFHIDTAGRVDDCAVVKSSFDFQRDRAACTYLMANARYRPASLDGAPVASWEY